MTKPIYFSPDLFEKMAHERALANNPYACEMEINAARIELCERNIWTTSILPHVIRDEANLS